MAVLPHPPASRVPTQRARHSRSSGAGAACALTRSGWGYCLACVGPHSVPGGSGIHSAWREQDRPDPHLSHQHNGSRCVFWGRKSHLVGRPTQPALAMGLSGLCTKLQTLRCLSFSLTRIPIKPGASGPGPGAVMTAPPPPPITAQPQAGAPEVSGSFLLALRFWLRGPSVPTFHCRPLERAAEREGTA